MRSFLRFLSEAAKLYDVSDAFLETLEARKQDFGVDINADAVERLTAFYGLVAEHNALLHLVAPCSPQEFATRHILESLTMLKHLREGAAFADVGSGAGLPAIPCLIARTDLSAILIESKDKKAAFLRETVESMGLKSRAEVVTRQFSEVAEPPVSVVCCRAIDRFADVLPKMMRWARKSSMLLFGGPNLRVVLERSRRSFTEELMPFSEQRYLFVVERPGQAS